MYNYVCVGHPYAPLCSNHLPDAYQILDLLHRATTRRIGDGPGRLFPCFEVGLLQQIDDARENVGIDRGLDLVPVAGRNVRDGPARLLADRLLGRAEQLQDRG